MSCNKAVGLLELTSPLEVSEPVDFVLSVELIVEEDRRLPLSIESELYRISQETLNNVVKHAKAHRIKVKLIFTKRRFRMEIWGECLIPS